LFSLAFFKGLSAALRAIKHFDMSGKTLAAFSGKPSPLQARACAIDRLDSLRTTLIDVSGESFDRLRSSGAPQSQGDKP
jgi:hypothetical protein